jgi:hypothetical protein
MSTGAEEVRLLLGTCRVHFVLHQTSHIKHQTSAKTDFVRCCGTWANLVVHKATVLQSLIKPGTSLDTPPGTNPFQFAHYGPSKIPGHP